MYLLDTGNNIVKNWGVVVTDITMQEELQKLFFQTNASQDFKRIWKKCLLMSHELMRELYVTATTCESTLRHSNHLSVES